MAADPAPPPPKRNIFSRLRTYLLILLLGVVLSAGIQWKYRDDLASALKRYQIESHNKSVLQKQHLEATFREIYHRIRTIARLPGVRTVGDKANQLSFHQGGDAFDPDAKLTIQEIYNDLASSVSISEVYIVPLNMDPDETDPNSTKPRQPLITFDEFIVGRHAEQHQDVQHEEQNELPETEIYEYRLMKKQIEWMLLNAPRLEDITGLDCPQIGGPEVITCDNTRYVPSAPNDKDRSGLVLSVPFYGLDGKLKGCVSAVILTHALRDHIGEPYWVLRNPAYDYTIEPSGLGSWKPPPSWISRLQPDPDLYYSETLTLQTADNRGRWCLWAGRPNELYWNR
jgi:hypothetical protein